MLSHRYPTSRCFQHPILIVFILMALAAGSVRAAQSTAGGPALVEVELDGPADAALLAGLPAYSLPISSGGRSYVLMPADRDLQAALTSQGLGVRVLESALRPAGYFLAFERRAGDLARLPEGSVLVRYERQALVAAPLDGAQALEASGLELQALQLTPFIASGAAAAPASPSAVTPNPVIQAMIDQVQTATLLAYENDLTGEQAALVGGEPYTILTRYSRTTTPIEKATQYAYEHLDDLGLATSYHEYSLPGTGVRRNVIAEQPGIFQPDRIVMLTAHLDSTSQSPTTLAPGADDNGSGSTGVLAAAEVLSQYDFGCTIRYALFTGEEQGLYGSAAYAAQAASLGADIEAVLNLDMIAYDSDAYPILDLYTRPANAGDLAIANTFTGVVDAYDLDLTPQVIQSGMGSSDHYPFWQNGFSAILSIEDMDDFTPYYHTTNDQVETLNMDYFTQFVKAAVGTIAHMGCFEQGLLAGTVTNAANGAPLPDVELRVELDADTFWTTRTQPDGSYSLSLLPGTYTVSTAPQGFDPFTTEVAIQAGAITTLDIALTGCTPLSGVDYTFSPLGPEAGEVITFSASISDGSSPILYRWGFGDGTRGAGQTATHVYAIAGTYNPILTVSNCGGALSTSHPVMVSGTPHLAYSPAAIEVALPGEGSLAQTLTISNTGTADLNWSLAADPPVEWLSLPQAAGSVPPFSSAPVDLVFSPAEALGAYTTTLRLIGNDPSNPQVEIPISATLTCTPVEGLDFTFTPETAWVGQQISFSAVMTAGSAPITYTWDLGDGSIISGTKKSVITYTYPLETEPQSYPVTLAAANACSAPPPVSRSIWVTPRQIYLPAVLR